MNIFKLLPLDAIEHVLSFGPTYYKENYKNRKGAFYKQIEESRKEVISNIYAPIKRRSSRERFTGYTTYFWERFLGGKYILYIEDLSSLLYDAEIENIDYDDEEYENLINQVEIDPERAYCTRFCRVSEYPNIGHGIHRMEEHHFDSSKIVYATH